MLLKSPYDYDFRVLKSVIRSTTEGLLQWSPEICGLGVLRKEKVMTTDITMVCGDRPNEFRKNLSSLLDKELNSAFSEEVAGHLSITRC